MSDNTSIPALNASSITASDTNGIDGAALSRNSPTCRSLYVGTTGNITVVMAHENLKGTQSTVTFSNVPVGIFPIQVAQVRSTGTTASNIVALF